MLLFFTMIIEEFTATKEHNLDFIDIKPVKINKASLKIMVSKNRDHDTLIVFGHILMSLNSNIVRLVNVYLEKFGILNKQ